MSALNIKPTHKAIKVYYAELKAYAKVGAEHEGAVRTAFQNLLQHYCRQAGLILVCEKTRTSPPDKGVSTRTSPPDKGVSTRTSPLDKGGKGGYRRIRVDGEIVDAYDLPHGHWEAKDTHDDLPTEAKKKFEAGYPLKKYHHSISDPGNPLPKQSPPP